MISYKKIGNFGRLGNQLFQFASTYGIAKKLGYEVKFPIENMTEPSIEDFKDGVRREITFDVPKYFEVPKDLLCSIKDINTEWTVREPNFHFFEEMFSIPDSVNLEGYYQTEKYFKHCEDELRNILQFDVSILDTAANYVLPKTDLELVSIHMRVGDYAGLQQFHPVLTSEYYSKALEIFTDKDYHFVVFSDDVEYAKSMLGDQENLTYSINNSTEVDMCAMSLCHHNIIANSSFSWWAAWLNNNEIKKAVAPKNWFGPAYYGIHDIKDLCPESWIVI